MLYDTCEYFMDSTGLFADHSGVENPAPLAEFVKVFENTNEYMLIEVSSNHDRRLYSADRPEGDHPYAVVVVDRKTGYPIRSAFARPDWVGEDEVAIDDGTLATIALLAQGEYWWRGEVDRLMTD
jgi:hypothetical protein